MKTFSKILEDLENKKIYKVQVELVVVAESEGEAAYISDAILSTPKYTHKYTINNIKETGTPSELKNNF